jgi:hypothetical protein
MEKKFFIFLTAILLFSCRKELEGDRVQQGLPETFVVVDSIRRDTGSYLITTVQAYWWGNSPRGYITGYEVSTDGMQTWSYTTKQSGIFLLKLPVGVKSGQIPVYVRAIDNNGFKDATPAQMIFPVRNSQPRIALDPGNALPDNSYPVIRFYWISSDIDGMADIDHYELALNDISDTNTYFKLPGTLSDINLNDTSSGIAIRLEGEQLSGVYTENCKVYQGNKTIPLAGYIKGLKPDSMNVIYVRAVDKTGNRSLWESDSLFIHIPVSDVLLVNALYSNASVIQNFYLNNLAKSYVGITKVETLRGVNSIAGNTELYTDAVTQQRTFSLFKKIIWLTDDPNTLATVQLTTGEFFNAGGHMFIFSQFGDDFPANSQVMNFTPIQSLVDPNTDPNTANGRFRMDNTCETVPNSGGWPILKYNGSIAVARPFNTNTTSSGIFSYDSLVNATIRIQTSSGSPYWTGGSTVMSRRVRIVSGKADMVISSLPLQNLNGNSNMDTFFRKVFIDELSF